MSEDLRDLCTHLLGGIPDEGLYELYETMKQICDFYEQLAAYVPPPPVALPPFKRVIIRTATTRIDYPLDEDDLR